MTDDSSTLWLEPIPERYIARSPLHRSRVALQPILPNDAVAPETWSAFRRSKKNWDRFLVAALPGTDDSKVSLMCGWKTEPKITLLDIRFEQGIPTLLDDTRVLVRAKQTSTFPLHAVHIDRHGHIYCAGGEYCLTRVGQPGLQDAKPEGVVRTSAGLMGIDQHTKNLFSALAAPSSHRKALGVRHFEPHLSSASTEVLAAILAHLEHGGELYARQVACSLGEIANTKRGLRALCQLMIDRADDPWLRLAIRTGLEGFEFKFFSALSLEQQWEEARPGRFEAVRELASDILHSGRRSEVRRLLGFAEYRHIQDWQVQALARAFGVDETVDAKEALQALQALRRQFEFESTEVEQRFETGQELYERHCTECHRPSGFGKQDRSPERRVFATGRGVEGLRTTLMDSDHREDQLRDDLMDLYTYLQLEWKALNN